MKHSFSVKHAPRCIYVDETVTQHLFVLVLQSLKFDWAHKNILPIQRITDC